MLGTLARGTYVLVLTAMVVAWVVSFTREPAAVLPPDQPTWYIYS
jgi:hypothetical protein